MSHNMDLQIFQRKHLTKNIIDVSDKNIKITIIFILYIFSIIIVLMFEISVDKIAFETTLAHLSDELFSKEVEITNIELDFSKKF